MMPTDDAMLERIQEIVGEVLRILPVQVKPDSLLGDELGAESMDFVDIQFRLETDCGVEFFHGSVVEKLSELLAPKNLEEDGLLTSFGAAVLKQRMPEVDPERLSEGQPVAGIESHFTPRTWLRVLKELLAARPQICPSCNAERFKIAKLSVLLCEACQTETQCSNGEKCLEDWAKNLAPSLQQVGE